MGVISSVCCALLLFVVSVRSDGVTYPSISSTKAAYNYCNVLAASNLFYEAQKLGKLTGVSRVPFKFDCMLADKGNNGEDLTGGYQDAGDHVKFGYPFAFAFTMLGWGAIDYWDAYTLAGETTNLLSNLKWAYDYMLKAYNPTTGVFYGQVGTGEDDHSYWCHERDWASTHVRPAFSINRTACGSDLAAETAAALAAGSIIWTKYGNNATYAAQLLSYAKSLYNDALNCQGLYSSTITDANSYYKSGGFTDELPWGALWLYRATGNSTYLTTAQNQIKQYSIGFQSYFNWDVKNNGVILLWAELTNGTSSSATSAATSVCNSILGITKTTHGLLYVNDWGSLRLANNLASNLLICYKLGISASSSLSTAQQQVAFSLGPLVASNTSVNGRAGGYVVGVGPNPPIHPHSSTSACSSSGNTNCNSSGNYGINCSDPNPHNITGALVGGPEQNEAYTDTQSDYQHNEVALDYNAGFQTTVAGLLHLAKSC